MKEAGGEVLVELPSVRYRISSKHTVLDRVVHDPSGRIPKNSVNGGFGSKSVTLATLCWVGDGSGIRIKYRMPCNGSATLVDRISLTHGPNKVSHLLFVHFDDGKPYKV